MGTRFPYPKAGGESSCRSWTVAAVTSHQKCARDAHCTLSAGKTKNVLFCKFQVIKNESI